MTSVVLGEWVNPAAPLVLSADAVHVWKIPLSETASRGMAVGGLSTEELDRASRFRYEADRRRFLAAHLGLRSILAEYLRVLPASLVFRAGPGGKPGLDHDRHGTALRFNLSHSHDLALVAVAGHREVGVDVEHLRPLPDLDEVIARFFSPAECAALLRLSPGGRHQAFFRCWTLKEAYLKARGEGMRRGLDRIEVVFEGGQPTPALRVLDYPGQDRRCELFLLAPSSEYVAAVAVQTP